MVFLALLLLMNLQYIYELFTCNIISISSLRVYTLDIVIKDIVNYIYMYSVYVY